MNTQQNIDWSAAANWAVADLEECTHYERGARADFYPHAQRAQAAGCYRAAVMCVLHDRFSPVWVPNRRLRKHYAKLMAKTASHPLPPPVELSVEARIALNDERERIAAEDVAASGCPWYY